VNKSGFTLEQHLGVIQKAKVKRCKRANLRVLSDRDLWMRKVVVREEKGWLGADVTSFFSKKFEDMKERERQTKVVWRWRNLVSAIFSSTW